jgi:hypothetical protein
MIPGSWRYAAASTLGTSHAKLGTPCQDAHACEVVLSTTGKPVLVAVVADGAGSASRSQDGARLACDFVAAEVRAFCDAGGAVGDLSRETVTGWLERLQAEIAALATAEDLSPRDFACTLVAAVLGEEHAAFLQLGDGAMVVSEGDDYAWIFWPDQGEYENLTVFVTDPQSLDRLQLDVCERRIEEIALFSDGLQRLVLNYQSRTAHAPFFRSLLSTVRAAGDGEDEASLSARLAAYLDSSAVNDRTDDDKTLILATRRP